MLSSDEIERTYDELQTMFVEIDPRPELGLGYVRERVTFCRAMQDRLAEIRLRVNREWSETCERHLIARQTQEVAPSPEHKTRAAELKVAEQRHAMLAKMVAAQAQVLSRTAMDLRLLADITKEQIKSGEIDPKESPGLIADVTPAGPAAEPVFEPASTEPATLAGDTLFGAENPPGQAAEPDPARYPRREDSAPRGASRTIPSFFPGETPAAEPTAAAAEPVGPDSFGGEDFPSEPAPSTMAAVEEVLASPPPKPKRTRKKVEKTPAEAPAEAPAAAAVPPSATASPPPTSAPSVLTDPAVAPDDRLKLSNTDDKAVDFDAFFEELNNHGSPVL